MIWKNIICKALAEFQSKISGIKSQVLNWQYSGQFSKGAISKGAISKGAISKGAISKGANSA